MMTGLLGLVLWCASWPILGQELIAHADAGVETLTANEARLLFTMRRKTWPNGTPVRVFVLPDDHQLHGRISKELLGLYPYQLRRVWDRQLFSGTGQAPVTLATEQEMLDRIASTPGAIGYSNRPITNPNIRALEVR